MATLRDLFERANRQQEQKDIARKTESRQVAEQENPELKQKFDRVLRGKMDRIPPGLNVESKLPSVRSLTLLRPAKEGGAMQVVVYFASAHGFERHDTLSVSPDGQLVGQLSPDLAKKASRNQILGEVLDVAEKIHIESKDGEGQGFQWIETDLDIFPPSGEGMVRGPNGEQAEKRANLTREQLDRIGFMAGMPDIAFGFVNAAKGGFKGYHGFVFRSGFVVLEHPEQGNAAYFIDHTPAIDSELGEDGARDYLKQKWVEDLAFSRKEHRQTGTAFVTHTGTEDEWTKKLIKEIEKRVAAADKTALASK